MSPACGCTALVHGRLCAPAVRFCSWPVRTRCRPSCHCHPLQMYLGEIAAAIPLFTEAYQADRGELPPEPRMANDLAVALGAYSPA